MKSKKWVYSVFDFLLLFKKTCFLKKEGNTRVINIL